MLATPGNHLVFSTVKIVGIWSTQSYKVQRTASFNYSPAFNGSDMGDTTTISLIAVH